MRLAAILLSAFVLGACGFTPLYQNTSTVSGDASVLQNIWIDTIPNESGLELRNGLIDRFYHHGYPSQTDYLLSIALQERGRNIVIEKDDVTTRTQLVITANYTLKDRRTQEVVEKGSLRGVSSYNILQSQYTTTITRNDARRQVLGELADKITMRMAVVLRDRP